MNIIDEAALTEALRVMPPHQCVAFAAACCERMLPAYEAFSTMEQWGDATRLRQALDIAWSVAAQSNIDRGKIRSALEACDDTVPDSDDFNSIFASGAQNAANGIAYTLEYCLDHGDVEKVVLPARLAVEAIEQYLNQACLPTPSDQEVYKRFDRWVKASPLMQAELESQAVDLEAIRATELLDDAVLQELRERSKKGGIQPFERGIIVKRKA